MFNFSNIDLFTQALGIEDPWKLDEVDFDKEICITSKRFIKPMLPRRRPDFEAFLCSLLLLQIH